MASSELATPAQIAPYDDSLFVREYEVAHVVSGFLPEPHIRVAHWAVLASEPVAPPPPHSGDTVTLDLVPFDSVDGLDQIHLSDDLDPTLDIPLYLDVSGTLAARPDSIPAPVRFDYRGGYSPRFEAYWMLRSQLRLLVVGHSHAGVGVLPNHFYPSESAATPLALNLSIPAAGFFQQRLVVDDYAVPLPDLRWVVWELSPRVFNSRYADGWRFQQFLASTGYRYDLTHRDSLWPISAAPPEQRIPASVTEEISERIDAWGGTKKGGVDPEYAGPQAIADKIASAGADLEFTMNEEVWPALESTLEKLAAQGVSTFLFIAPMHPAFASSPAADNDQTGPEDYAAVVRRLAALDAAHPKVYFRDFHRDGNHQFGPDHFWDLDHLNADGARAFTPILVDTLAEIDPAIAQ
ncbi:hypothetical protein BH23VER1_BH23VER1_23820 [soil metagenome]